MMKNRKKSKIQKGMITKNKKIKSQKMNHMK